MSETLPEYITAVNPSPVPTWEEMFSGVPRIRIDKPTGRTFVDKIEIRIFSRPQGIRTETHTVSMWSDFGLYLDGEWQTRYYYQGQDGEDSLFTNKWPDGAPCQVKVWLDAKLAQFISEAVQDIDPTAYTLFEMLEDGRLCDAYAKRAEFESELSALVFHRAYLDWQVLYQKPILYEMLGDGIRLDPVWHRATFYSEASASIFRHRYPFYEVGHVSTVTPSLFAESLREYGSVTGVRPL